MTFDASMCIQMCVIMTCHTRVADVNRTDTTVSSSGTCNKGTVKFDFV